MKPEPLPSGGFPDNREHDVGIIWRRDVVEIRRDVLDVLYVTGGALTTTSGQHVNERVFQCDSVDLIKK